MTDAPTGPRRYRFGDFVLSPSRRLLLLGEREVRLIPRYFDLLLLLIERRHEAVSRQEILDRVWSDVVVSDGALTQAVRTLRRTLGDDPREPRYIRTLARHGYRFVHADVVEEADGGELAVSAGAVERREPEDEADRFEPLLATLLGGRALGGGEQEEDRRRAAAEELHALGTEEALRRLGRRPGHEIARAWLREVRWDTPDAGPVPILGRPGGLRTGWLLVSLRIRRALRMASRRSLNAAGGGASAGTVAGLLGGAALMLGPGSKAGPAVPVALAMVGAVIGGLGALGVGSGLALAEALARSFRGAALIGLGAAGGGLTASLAHGLGGLAAQGLFGRDLSPVAGGLEGLTIGAATGLGYALATAGSEGMAAPRGLQRVRTAVIAAICCALATVTLSTTGSYLGAMSLDLLAQRFPRSEVGLVPLARLLGETHPGRITLTVIGAWEGLMFGLGTILGLTHRPRPRRAR